MKGGTGVVIDNQQLKQNFIEFLDNSYIEFLSSGAYGIVFKATLDPQSGYVSKYKMLDYKNFGKPVDTIVFKMGVIDYKTKPALTRYPQEIAPDSFRREVNVQTDIFLKTMQYLQPLCPAIVYSDIHTNTDADPIIDHIINRISGQYAGEDRNTLQQLKISMSRYTIIGMEMLNDYEMLHTVRTKIAISGNNAIISKPLYKAMIAYILIELAVKTGYSHADFHAGNIMINLNDDTYFKGKPASIILIDFGLTTKIKPSMMKKIKNDYADKNYTEIIKALCNDIPRPDGLMLSQFDLYDYMCKVTPENNMIDELFNAREEAIADITKISGTNPDIPKLPLSNAHKNKMYSGLIEPVKMDTIEAFNLSDRKELDLLDKLNTLNNWICGLVKTYFKTVPRDPNDHQWEDPNWYKYLIDSIYFTAYLIRHEDRLDKSRTFLFSRVMNYQLAAVVAMYCAGINNTNGPMYYILNKKGITIFEEFNDLCNGGTMYSIKTITNACTTYAKLLDNFELHSIKNYVELPLDFTDFRMKLTNVSTLHLLYSDPIEWMKMNYPAEKPLTPDTPPRKRATQRRIGTSGQDTVFNIPMQNEEFVFPFKGPKDMFGGKRKTAKRRNRKTNRIRRYNRHSRKGVK